MAALDAGTFTDFDHAGPLVSSAIAGLKLCEVSEPWSQNDAPLVTTQQLLYAAICGYWCQPGHARGNDGSRGHAAIAEHVGLGSGDRYSAEQLAQVAFWCRRVLVQSHNRIE